MALDRRAVALLGVGFSRELVAFDGLLPVDGGEVEDSFVLPTSIVDGALGTPRVDLVVHGQGFSDAVYGIPRIDLAVLPTSFTQTAFGTPRIDLAVLVPGFSSSALGTPRLDLTVHPYGGASSEAAGTPTVIAGEAIFPVGISSEVVGTPRIDVVVLPASIADGAFGIPVIGIPIYPTSIPSGEAAGTPRIDLVVGPSSWEEASFGMPRIDQAIFSASTSSGESFGSIRIDLQLLVTPISEEELGQPTIAVSIHPVGVVSTFAAGKPRLDHALLVRSVVYTTSIGVPTVLTDRPYHRPFQPRPPQFNAWRPLSTPAVPNKGINIRFDGSEGPSVVLGETVEGGIEVPIALADVSAAAVKTAIGRAVPTQKVEEKESSLPTAVATPTKSGPGGSAARVQRTVAKTPSLPSGSGKSKKPT